ncbi:MAG TPA: glycine cleavage system protein GcvH [Acidimicrobiia bacterium]|nr:glycine cleavage system protein GcvH [Acidimicrobiia bacterium]
MDFPEDLRYSAEHEWVRVDGSRATIGITDYAQDALGDVVFVELPDVGAALEPATACAEVESTKSVSDIYAPVAGTVVEVNGELETAPERLNEDPYGGGWLFSIEMTDPAELGALMDAAAYRAMVDEG